MKLLTKTMWLYLLYAVAILIVAVPVFYFTIQKVVKEDADESLQFRKNKIVEKLKRSALPPDNNSIEMISTGVELFKTDILRNQDSIYNSLQYDSASQEMMPYRILQTSVLINGQPYQLKLKDSLVDTEDLAVSIGKIAAIIIALIIAGLYLINWYISKKTWRPFYETVQKLNVFRIDNNEPIQLPSTKINEFSDLNKAITNLVSTNQKVYQLQKEFTENASHEMQTPLAILQGKIDLLMQTNPLNAEQAELISDLATVNQRMNHLNKSLLLLTKIENNQFTETEKISVSVTLTKLIEQYRFQAQQKGIIIKSDVTEYIFIVANKSLIDIMLGNFISNAIKHNKPGGAITITSKKSEVKFSNSSNAERLNEDKMFQRFQKQTTDSTSIGLGLQIAKKIADMYKIGIRYDFKDSQQQFLIFFKNDI